VSKNKTARALATWLGCGLSPVAPGTVGSLGAIPLHLVLRRLNPVVHFASVVCLTGIGVWASQRVADEEGLEDPQLVVIDEVAGALMAMGLVRGAPLAEALALVLFRVLDITKPGPVGQAEKATPAGLGIMLDDVVAGLMAGFVIRLGR
jgi:phosphatidylglycerophosphatase A